MLVWFPEAAKIRFQFQIPNSKFLKCVAHRTHPNVLGTSPSYVSRYECSLLLRQKSMYKDVEEHFARTEDFVLGYSTSAYYGSNQTFINCLSSLLVKSKHIAFDYDLKDRFFSYNVVFDCSLNLFCLLCLLNCYV